MKALREIRFSDIANLLIQFLISFIQSVWTMANIRRYERNIADQI